MKGAAWNAATLQWELRGDTDAHPAKPTTDAERNAAVAREVMGVEYDLEYQRAKSGMLWVDWSPSTSIADAFEVVERVPQPATLTRHDNGRWLVEFWPRTNDENYGGAEADTLPRAICEAALEAVRAGR